MSCLVRWCIRNREGRDFVAKKSQEDTDEEWEKCMEQNKMKGRRKAICEMSLADREALVTQLERYVRMHRLNEYGIIRHKDIRDSAYYQHLNEPLLRSCALTDAYELKRIKVSSEGLK